MTLSDLLAIYTASDGGATSRLYERLAAFGGAGAIAVNLFRACKSSERAKVYRGGGYRGRAYQKKEWSMGNLCSALTDHAAGLGIIWGWGIDEKQPYHRHVLYVELPTGQVSFHAAERGAGPSYPRAWDGAPGVAPTRICRWIAQLFAEAAA